MGWVATLMTAVAVLRLLEIKQRPLDKGLILIAAQFAALQSYLAPIGKTQLIKLRRQLARSGDLGTARASRRAILAAR